MLRAAFWLFLAWTTTAIGWARETRLPVTVAECDLKGHQELAYSGSGVRDVATVGAQRTAEYFGARLREVTKEVAPSPLSQIREDEGIRIGFFPRLARMNFSDFVCVVPCTEVVGGVEVGKDGGPSRVRYHGGLGGFVRVRLIRDGIELPPKSLALSWFPTNETDPVRDAGTDFLEPWAVESDRPLPYTAAVRIARSDGQAFSEGQYRVTVELDQTQLTNEDGSAWRGSFVGATYTWEVRPTRDAAEELRALAHRAESMLSHDPEGALALFLDLDEMEPRYGFTIAHALMQLGRYEEAIPYLERARRENAHNTFARNALTLAYVAAGRIEQASALLRQERGFDEDEVRREVDRLLALTRPQTAAADSQ